MNVEVGIMLAAYAGLRLYEKSSRRNKRKSSRRNRRLAAAAEHQPSQQPLSEIVEQPSDRLVGKMLKPTFRQVTFVSMGLAAARQFVYPPLAPISLALFIYTAIPYMRRVETALLKERKINVDVLFFTADAMTLGLSQYLTAAFGVWMINEGKAAIESAQDRSEKMLIDIFAQQPRQVWLLLDGVEVATPLEQVGPGDIIAVTTGEVIPCDGVIVNGFASIDQHALTGESQPAEKGIGDQALASTLVLNGQIHLKVEKSGQDTTIAKVGQILTASTNYKSQIQLKGERWSNQATMPMLLAAMAVFPVFGAVSTIVFINSHIGVRVRIFAPLGTLNHVSLAAHKGILVKDGRALEMLNGIDTVVFDKTGTLTDEQPLVGDVILCGAYPEQEVLAFAAAAERKFTHPIARAILRHADEAGLTLPEVDDSHYKVGYGVTVALQGRTIRVGSRRFMQMEGLSIPDLVEQQASGLCDRGSSLIFVAVNDAVAAAIEIRPQVRKEVKGIIAGLRRRGIKHIAIVSGDHREPTRNLAQTIGVDEYFCDILPEQKADIVQRLQDDGRAVCFIGDGVNDAIALKKANVSISLAGATTIATDVAEVVLMDGSLTHLCEVFDISDKLNDNLKNTLLYSIVPGAINLSGAFVFHYSIMTAFLVNGTFGVLTLNNVLQPIREIARSKDRLSATVRSKSGLAPRKRSAPDLTAPPVRAVRACQEQRQHVVADDDR